MKFEEKVAILILCAAILINLHSMIYLNFIPFIISLSMIMYALVFLPSDESVQKVATSEDES